MFNQVVEIEGTKIGNGCAPYVIAEVSGNHGGDLDRAKALIMAAKEAGANAVKLQTYTAETMTIDCDKEDFVVNEKDSLWRGRSLYDLYGEASTPWDWHAELFALARSIGITIFSTPFDTTAVDFLETMNVPCYKISSFECTDIHLIRHIAKTNKPIIISTGTAKLSEVAKSAEELVQAGCKEVIMLSCVSLYPAPPEATKLSKIKSLKDLFGCPSGLSDHSIGSAIPIAAIGAGANLIEKHFTLDDDVKTIDSDFSIKAKDLKKMCSDIKIAGDAVGISSGEWSGNDQAARKYRRSLYFTKSFNTGDLITEDGIKSVRPGFGISTEHYYEVIGKRVSSPVTKGDPVTMYSVSD